MVAVVDIPYSVLEPTHNKQSFENKREYMNVLKAINDHMVQYWTDVAIGATPGGVGNFWYGNVTVGRKFLFEEFIFLFLKL